MREKEKQRVKRNQRQRAFTSLMVVITANESAHVVRSPPMFPMCNRQNLVDVSVARFQPSGARAAFLLIDYSFFRILISASRHAYATKVIAPKPKEQKTRRCHCRATIAKTTDNNLCLLLFGICAPNAP